MFCFLDHSKTQYDRKEGREAYKLDIQATGFNFAEYQPPMEIMPPMGIMPPTLIQSYTLLG